MPRVLTGIAAALALLLLIAGVPILLVFAVGNPLPANLAQFPAMLLRPDGGGRLLMGTVLPLITWAAWAYFAWSIALETADRLRGRHVTARGLMRPGRGAASVLVGAVAALVLGTTSPAHASPAQAAEPREPSAQLVIASAGHTAMTMAQDGPGERGEPGERERAPTSPVITVRDGDTLWSLAERHLGSGGRFSEIAEANMGLPQADGGALDEELWLTPGWQLTLPADALLPGAERVTPRDGPAGASDTEDQGTLDGHPGMIRVEAGDTLWDLAQQHLGDGARYPEIVSATGIEQPDELAVGQRIALPAPPARADGGGKASSAAAPPDLQAAQTELPEPELAEQEPPEQEDDAQSAVPDGPLADTIRIEVDTHTVGGLGAVIAAGLVGWIGIRRRAQRRARRPGARIAVPPARAQELERELRAIARGAGTEDLDAVLRCLASAGREADGFTPDLVSMRIIGDEHMLHLARPVLLRAPFLPASAEGSEWHVTVPPPASGEEGTGHPYAALMCLGDEPGGGRFFVNLESIGVLGISGDEEDSEAMLAATALELATSPWSSSATITVLGGSEGTVDMLSTGRIRHVPDARALARELRGRAQSTRQALDSLGFQDILDARTQDEGEAWGPEIVIACPGAVSAAEELAEIADLARAGRACGIAIIGTGIPGAAWTLHVHGNGTGMLRSPGGGEAIELRTQRLSARERLEVEQIASAAFMPDTPGPAWARPLLDESAQNREPERQRPAGGHAGPAWHAPREARAETQAQAPATPAEPAKHTEPTAPTASAEDASAPARRRDAREVRSEPLDAEARALVEQLSTRPWVRLLGPVALENAAGPAPRAPQGDAVNRSTMNRASELIAFLALHPGASAVQVHAALWPGRQPHGKAAAANRNGLVSKARRWLGHAPDGAMYFPHIGSSGYRLHEEVTTDWQIFQMLIGEDVSQTPAPRLRAAADLVRGEPLTGVKDRYYAWAEVLRMEMLAGVGDVCHELVRRSLLAKDAAGARAAAALARQVDPVNEAAWRDALRAEALAKDAAGFERIVAQLTHLLTELEVDEEPEPQTQALIDEVRRSLTEGSA